MYFEDVIIHGVHTTIGDAEITVYRVEGINRNPVIPIDSPETPLLIHDHFYYELHLMTAEQTGFVIGDSRIPLECGSLLVIPPHTAHYPFPENESAQELVFALTMNITDGEAGFFSYFLSSLQEIACRAYPPPEPLFQQMCAFHPDSTPRVCGRSANRKCGRMPSCLRCSIRSTVSMPYFRRRRNMHGMRKSA